jgi:hypothetical protein
VNQYWQRVRPVGQRDRNPLCRSVDRAEARALTALVVLALSACFVLGVLAGHRADSLSRAEQRAERGWRPAIATLEQSAAQSTTATSGWEVAWVPARWQLPDGQHRSGQVATDLDARAGQKVEIWINSAGQQTRPPMTSAGVWDQNFSTVLSLVMGIAIVAGLAAGSIRLLCNRRRMAGWQRAWDAIGPTWCRRA